MGSRRRSVGCAAFCMNSPRARVLHALCAAPQRVGAGASPRPKQRNQQPYLSRSPRIGAAWRAAARPPCLPGGPPFQRQIGGCAGGLRLGLICVMHLSACGWRGSFLLRERSMERARLPLHRPRFRPSSDGEKRTRSRPAPAHTEGLAPRSVTKYSTHRIPITSLAGHSALSASAISLEERVTSATDSSWLPLSSSQRAKAARRARQLLCGSWAVAAGRARGCRRARVGRARVALQL